jgi:hypothetical protein
MDKRKVSRRVKKNGVHLGNALARLAARMGVPGAVRTRTRSRDLCPEFSLGATRVVVTPKGRFWVFVSNGSIATTRTVSDCLDLVEKAINTGV